VDIYSKSYIHSVTSCAKSISGTINEHGAQNRVFLKSRKQFIMFAILPKSKDFLFDCDAEFFNSKDEAIDAAFDWSVELNGDSIQIFRQCGLNWVALTSVFA